MFLPWIRSTLRLAGAFPCCCQGGGSGGGSGARGGCFCCGPGYYDYQAPAGGPLEWKLSIGAITGSCLGSSCAAASGTFFAAYTTGCTWVSPRFTLCGAMDCFAWVFSIGAYPNCDANPVDRDAMRLILADLCSGTQLLRYENPCEARIGNPPSQCEPPVVLTCNGPNTLVQVASLGLCAGPTSVSVEPIY